MLFVMWGPNGCGKTSLIVGEKRGRRAIGETHLDPKAFPNLMARYGGREVRPHETDHCKSKVVDIGSRGLLYPWGLDGMTPNVMVEEPDPSVQFPHAAVRARALKHFISTLLDRGPVITDRVRFNVDCLPDQAEVYLLHVDLEFAEYAQRLEVRRRDNGGKGKKTPLALWKEHSLPGRRRVEERARHVYKVHTVEDVERALNSHGVL